MADMDRKHAVKAVVLALVMVLTGSVNTIAAKWADSLKVDGKSFNHPFVQTICMFVGELSCLFVYFITRFVYIRRSHSTFVDGTDEDSTAVRSIFERIFPDFNPLLFVAPAFCDVLATSIMYIGLNLTQASSFQMLRGAVIIFTGLFSVAFLDSYLQGFRWLGMGFVSIGLVIVGVSDIIFDENPKDDINGIITGDLLIVIAQIIVAIQMVIEQKLITEFTVPPLLVVGLEGLFGVIIMTALLIPMYYIKVSSTFSTNPHHRLEDLFDAFEKVKGNPWIGVSLLLIVISIAFFNFAGVSVTKELSATTRMVLDSVRTLFIWLLSIPLFGERFIPLQLVGFTLLIFGMFIYNDIFFGPYFRQKILPRINNNQLASCCVSFCGINMVHDDHSVLIEGSDDS